MSDTPHDRELACQRAVENVEEALCQMAANLMRVVRGAGSAFELPIEALKFVHAVSAYKEACGLMPCSDELKSMVMLPRPKYDGNDRVWVRGDAEYDVVRAALLLAAGLVLRQRLQVERGRADLYTALRRLE